MKRGTELRRVDEANAAIDDALVLMDELREKPSGAKVRYEIGSTLLRYGSPDEGLIWVKSSLEADPRYKPSYEVLVKHFTATGQADYAKQYQQQLDRLKD